jgi:GTP-binding protein HflX
LHVVDVSHPQADDQILAVNNVLDEIGAAGKPTLMVFNKMDRFEKPDILNRFLDRFPNAVGISAMHQTGFPALLSELGAVLRPIRACVELLIPAEASAVVARLHEKAQVLERDYQGSAVRLRVRLPPHLLPEFSKYIVPVESQP